MCHICKMCNYVSHWATITASLGIVVISQCMIACGSVIGAPVKSLE